MDATLGRPAVVRPARLAPLFSPLLVPFLAALLAVLALLSWAPAHAREPAITEVPVAQLPREARDTLALIRAGGPYPYRQDDGVFGNREKRLPPAARGHYREYTVKTPGAANRGARRSMAFVITHGFASIQKKPKTRCLLEK